MPIVNYVREHIRFMEYATDEHLTSSERLLWYALMHIFNQKAQGKVWPDEFIRISNDRLLTYCPMKYDTIAAARNSLRQRGLIEFTKGEKNKKSPAYRMIYFFPEYVAQDTEQDGECYPKNSEYIGGNMGGNSGGNIGYNMGGNSGGNIGDFNINYTMGNLYRTQRDFEDDDEEDEESSRARARAREEVRAAWKICFGRDATPAILKRLSDQAVMCDFEDGVISKAIQTAARKGANSPVDYILKVTSDWKENNVRTAMDADEYAFVFDAYQGKAPGGIDVSEGIDMMRAFRQDRETDEQRATREAAEAAMEDHARAYRERIQQHADTRRGFEYETERARLEREKSSLEARYPDMARKEGSA